jgi:hypothetical protein
MGELQLYGITNLALGEWPSVTPDDEHIVRTRAIAAVGPVAAAALGTPTTVPGRPALSGEQRKPTDGPDAECGDDAEDHDVDVPLAMHDNLRSRGGILSQLLPIILFKVVSVPD